MKRFRPMLFVAAMLSAAGCRAVDPPAPTPVPPLPNVDPVPVPAPAITPCTCVVVVDATSEGPGVYDSPALRAGMKSHGHLFYVVDRAVVDQTGKPPAELAVYLKAAGDTLPAIVRGRGGVELGSANAKLIKAWTAADVLKFADACPVPKVGAVPESGNQIWDGHEWRKLGGCKAPKPGLSERWKVYGTNPNEPLIPRDQWRDVDGDWMVRAILDQNGYSSCCPCAATGAYRAGMAGSGLPDVELSVADLYARINGGADQGAMPEDALTELCQRGVCSTKTAAMWGVAGQGHKGDWQNDRTRYRILKAELCPDADSIGSAIQRGRPVLFGTLVTDAFAPDANGIIGPNRGGRGGGHALYLVGYKSINGKPFYRVVNSWGSAWGDRGKAWLDESWLRTDYFQAWCISSIVFPSDTPVVQRTPAGSEPTPTTPGPMLAAMRALAPAGILSAGTSRQSRAGNFATGL